MFSFHIGPPNHTPFTWKLYSVTEIMLQEFCVHIFNCYNNNPKGSIMDQQRSPTGCTMFYGKWRIGYRMYFPEQNPCYVTVV